MVAQRAAYNNKCLIALYNRERGAQASADTSVDAVNHGIAFAELVSYIEEAHNDNLVPPVFYLSDLVNLYGERLEQLGTSVTGRIHSGRRVTKPSCSEGVGQGG